MELHYQNKYVVTRENINEFCRKASPLWKRIVFLPVFILLIGYGMYLITDEWHEIVFALVLAIYVSILLYRQAQKADKTLYARYCLNKLDNLERIVEFSDNITVYSPGTGGRHAFEFAHVYKFYKSKNLYVLMLPYAMGIYIEKGKFTVGYEAEFEAFIRNQCVHVKK